MFIRGPAKNAAGETKGMTMDKNMYCFQCEQTVGCTACTGAAGACGKTADVAFDQDELTGALIGLALTCQAGAQADDETYRLMMEGLFATLTNVNFDHDSLSALTCQAKDKAAALAKAAGIQAAPAYDMFQIWDADVDIRSLKSLVLFGARGVAAYAYHAAVLGHTNDQVNEFFIEALAGIAQKGSMDELLPLVMKVGEVNLTCMGMLDAANTGAFGTPEPTQVGMLVEKGPFIVVSGHDLYDLKCLLEQTQDKGVNVYTHCEMLPAHAYPELKKYPHLKGNFGTAWQNQRTEFDNIPAPVLFTTNCLMPPKASYADRVFTTEAVQYPELVHIGTDKDFTPVIEKALELGGYAEDTQFAGINGGTTLTTGFAQGAVLGVAGAVIDAVKAGKIRHFILVGGCDGSRPGRNYYTELVKQTPEDTVILTLACGKYRFNDLDLGTVADTGIPRLLDVGQCNDAFSAIQIAVALAGAFECGVNDLPLSMVLSWFEQKAVSILLTLLYLGITDIKLGPTLPAFVSPNVLDFLVQNFRIAPTTTPEADLADILG